MKRSSDSTPRRRLAQFIEPKQPRSARVRPFDGIEGLLSFFWRYREVVRRSREERPSPDRALRDLVTLILGLAARGDTLQLTAPEFEDHMLTVAALAVSAIEATGEPERPQLITNLRAVEAGPTATPQHHPIKETE